MQLMFLFLMPFFIRLLLNTKGGEGAVCEHTDRTLNHSNIQRTSQLISFLCVTVYRIIRNSVLCTFGMVYLYLVHEVAPYNHPILCIQFLWCKISWSPFDVNSNETGYGSRQQVYEARS